MQRVHPATKYVMEAAKTTLVPISTAWTSPLQIIFRTWADRVVAQVSIPHPNLSATDSPIVVAVLPTKHLAHTRVRGALTKEDVTMLVRYTILAQTNHVSAEVAFLSVNYPHAPLYKIIQDFFSFFH